MSNRKNLWCLITPLMFLAIVANASVVTLNQAGLMRLDYYNAGNYLTTRVIDKRISGDGVEFDISFLGNTGSDSQMFYGSSIFGGNGSLTIANLSNYDQFQIDVELIEIKGYTNQEAEMLEICFSPMVHDGVSYKNFNSQILSTASTQTKVTASMDLSLLAIGESKRGDLILDLGYEIHMDDPTVWPLEGTIVTLFLSPTTGADHAIPETTTISIFAIGALSLMFKRRLHA